MKYDQIAIEEVKKCSGGWKPEAYFYAEKGFNFGILTFFIGGLLGGILSLIIGKSYLVALQGEYIFFILTNGECSKFKGEHFKIHKSDIVEAKCNKFYGLHKFRLKLRDERVLRFQAMEAFVYLEDSPLNIAKFEKFLGISHL